MGFICSILSAPYVLQMSVSPTRKRRKIAHPQRYQPSSEVTETTNDDARQEGVSLRSRILTMSQAMHRNQCLNGQFQDASPLVKTRSQPKGRVIRVVTWLLSQILYILLPHHNNCHRLVPRIRTLHHHHLAMTLQTVQIDGVEGSVI